MGTSITEMPWPGATAYNVFGSENAGELPEANLSPHSTGSVLTIDLPARSTTTMRSPSTQQ